MTWHPILERSQSFLKVTQTQKTKYNRHMTARAKDGWTHTLTSMKFCFTLMLKTSRGSLGCKMFYTLCQQSYLTFLTVVYFIDLFDLFNESPTRTPFRHHLKCGVKEKPFDTQNNEKTVRF